MDWPFRLLVPWLSDAVITELYALAGADAGYALGLDDREAGLMNKLKTWSWWEQEYATRGFRPLPTEQFILHGGWGAELTGLGEKLPPGQLVHFYAPLILGDKLGMRSTR